MRRIAGAAAPIVAGALALGLALAKPDHAKADAASEAQEKAERCATRLSVAMLGKSPTSELLASKNPQEAVDAMLKDPAFVERFARFANSELNDEPGETVADDASYTLAKHVLTNDKPWKDMFVGEYDVTDTVTADPNGLGYFRSRPWMVRYAGNEEDGYVLAMAYRILQNTTGLQLTAVTLVQGVKVDTATRAENPGCRGCHYDGWYALDKVARVLKKRQGTDPATMKFVAPSEGPQQILDNKTIANDKELVTALVESTDFKVNASRLAFKFLYGRGESACEGEIFDKAMDAFSASGSIKDAVAVVAKDPGFCQ